MGKKKRPDPRRREKKRSIHPPRIEETIVEDAILSHIISYIPLREAVRTSVLSSRWRHIWTHLPKLRFDAANMLNSRTLCTINQDDTSYTGLTKEQLWSLKRYLLDRKTNWFIDFVDSVLQQFHNRVDEIVVEYFLHKAHSHHLDAWVRFAASKARRLVLDLEQQYVKKNIEIELYDFPCHMLGSLSSIEELSLVSCSLKVPCKFDGFRLLKVLSLHDIDITSEDINLLLSSCSALQKLDVWMSKELVSLSIPCTLNQLHYLSVKQCDQFREVNINAPNLNTLHYEGVPLDFRFIPSSQLKDVSYKTKWCMPMPNLDCFLTELSSNIPHLQSLSLSIGGVPQVDDLPKVSNSFLHLTHVKWKWIDTYKMSVIHLATLLDAAPFLEELKLRFATRVAEPPPPTELQKSRKKLPGHLHSCLKRIEISLFSFDMWQFEAALYLLQNATQLESMMIEKDGNNCWGIRGVHEMINNLTKQVPRNVKFGFSNSL